MNKITAKDFENAVGRPPLLDDLERCNCDQAGAPGHLLCGWCDEHKAPKFLCGCSSTKNKITIDFLETLPELYLHEVIEISAKQIKIFAGQYTERIELFLEEFARSGQNATVLNITASSAYIVIIIIYPPLPLAMRNTLSSILPKYLNIPFIATTIFAMVGDIITEIKRWVAEGRFKT